MSDLPPQTPLHAFIFDRLIAAFGQPHRIVGNDRQWGLQRGSSLAAINVLADGRRNEPVIWIFDPHDPVNGIVSHIIKDESEIDPIVEDIRRRIASASRPDLRRPVRSSKGDLDALAN